MTREVLAVTDGTGWLTAPVLRQPANALTTTTTNNKTTQHFFREGRVPPVWLVQMIALPKVCHDRQEGRHVRRKWRNITALLLAPRRRELTG